VIILFLIRKRYLFSDIKNSIEIKYSFNIKNIKNKRIKRALISYNRLSFLASILKIELLESANTTLYKSLFIFIK